MFNINKILNTDKVKTLEGQFSYMLGEMLRLREEVSLLRDELETVKKNRRAGDEKIN